MRNAPFPGLFCALFYVFMIARRTEKGIRPSCEAADKPPVFFLTGFTTYRHGSVLLYQPEGRHSIYRESPMLSAATVSRSLYRAGTARTLLCLFALIGLPMQDANGQDLLLYENDFETPNIELERNCGFALDVRGINTLYGTVENPFYQINTVEAVLINDPTYSDPSEIGGNYAIGMLSNAEDDRLALTFDAQGRNYINVIMDISAIDVDGCGGPFNGSPSPPIFRLSLIDSPGGTFEFGVNTTLLDEADVEGVVGADPYTFNWTPARIPLDASESADGNVTVVWNLLQSGYGAFDNLVIKSSDMPVSVEEAPREAPGGYVLSAVYPNPFNPSASFRLDLRQPQRVRLGVHDVLGEEVLRLHDGLLSAGEHRFEVQGAALPSGLYLVRAVGERFRATRRAVLLK